MVASIGLVCPLVRNIESADDALAWESDHTVCTRIGEEPLSFVTSKGEGQAG